MQRQWPLVKANGFILVSESSPEIISASSKAVNFQPFRFWNGFVTAVLILKPPCGIYRSETATWIQKCFKKSVGASKKL
jgi:hypothetical protein